MTEEIHYSYYNGTNCFRTVNFYEALHEMLSHLVNNNFNASNELNVVHKNTNDKKYEIIVDVISVDRQYVVRSKNRNIACNIKTNPSMLREFTFYNYDKKYSFELSINNLLTKNVTRNNVQNDAQNSSQNSAQNNAQNTKQNKTKQKMSETNMPEIKNDLDSVLKNINQLNKNINTESKIETVIFPDEIFSDKSDVVSYDSNFDDNDDNDADNDADNDDADEDKETYQNIKVKKSKDDIASEIKKLEIIKKQVKDTVDDLKKITVAEQENMSRFSCVVRDLESEIKKEDNEKETEYKVFLSEKGYTYPKILQSVFLKKGFEAVPDMFITKFVIYLYMDGMDADGNVVRKKLLGREDEFEIFQILYDVIVDEDFEIPEDNEYCDIVADFTSQLPPIILPTSDDIMDILNEADDSYAKNEIFQEDEIEEHSAPEDDDAIDNMTMPKIRKGKK